MSEAGHDGSEHVLPPLRSVGKPVDEVDVVLNTRFFELFSRNLYRSPNKAFEELVSNSWDAGAASVYIGIPQGLKKLDATVWILDNGESMDAAGLKQLWRIADSRKARLGKRHGREPIGKFGIGKLATYLLAARLTYVCKAADGKIRLVEMDYSEIEKRTDAPDGTAGGDLLLGGKSGVKLPLNELSEAEFEELLQLLPDGMRIRTLIKAGVPKPTLVGAPDDEFRHPDETTEEVHNTWTLAVMTDLKTLGRGMQLGWIRYMLRAALPLGRTMAISLNDETLTSTKLALPVEKELALDKGLGFWEFEHRDPEDPTTKKTFTITPHSTPYPHVTIDGFEGRITGTIKRYVSSISGKKSDELERSNGYFINVLGRVVNAEDPYFGLENLNHSVWSQFRMCVRADGLNPLIGINREQLNDDERLRVFRSFLREAFNQMRREVDDPLKNAWKDAGKIIAKSWGAIPLRSFQRALRIYGEDGTLPDSIIASPGADVKFLVSAYARDVAEDPARGLSEVEFRDVGHDRPLFVFDLESRAVIVNLAHPFVRMRANGEKEQAVLKDVAVAETLATARLTDIGVDETLIADYAEYRDQLYRVLTLIRRDSGVTIAESLIRSVDDEKALEVLVGYALEFLGFDVEVMGERGEPEGVAVAKLQSSRLGHKPATYSLTYEAKSTGKTHVSAEKVGVSTVDHHRVKHRTDYVLVVGKDFSAGMLEEMCLKARVTPMRAQDLARLLLLAAGTGPLDLDRFRRIFDLSEPKDVEDWITEFIKETLGHRRVSLIDILDVIGKLDDLPPEEPVNAQLISRELRKRKKAPFDVSSNDIVNIFQGLHVLVPSLCLVQQNDIYLGTSPEKFREAVLQQISVIPPEFRFALQSLNG